MSAYIHTNNQARIGVLIFALAIHALFGWMLVTGLAKSVVEKVFEPLVTDIVEEEIKEDKPPPPPPPEMERPPVEVPPPEVAIDMPVEVAQTTALSNVTDKPAPPPPPPAPVARPTPAKIRTPADPDQFYPAASARAEEQGSATVEACVDAKGKLVREPQVRATSGHARLDEAAVKVARATRYTAGTQNGQPMAESCISFRVKFQLKN